MEQKLDNIEDKSFIIKLYDEYNRFVYILVKSYIYSKNEDDIMSCVNDVFLKALLKIDKIKNHENIKAWLVLTVKYTVMNLNKKYLRELKKHTCLDDEYENLCIDDFTDMVHDEIIFGNLNMDEIKQSIINSLSNNELELYKLKYEKKYDNSHIALLLKINENNVRAKLSRLHKRVREITNNTLEKYVK